MIEDFKRHFPLIAEDVVEYREDDPSELFIKTNVGETYIFDAWDKSLYRLPDDSGALSENECRREFGRRLRKIMIRKGLTQNELSEMTGIPQSMLSGYMSGRINPGFYNVDRIAKALNCSVDDFRYL